MTKLMVVDDEFYVRRGILDSIPWEQHGIEACGEAATAEEALELVPRLCPDIMLVDIRMGAMTGLELIERLLAQQTGIKFIILSGYGEFEYAQQAITYGVSEYLLKPIGAEALVKAVLRVKASLDDSCRRQPPEAVLNQENPMMQWTVPKEPLPLDNSSFRILVFHPDRVTDKLRFGLADRPTILQACRECAVEYLTGIAVNHIITAKYAELFVVMLNYRQLVSGFEVVCEGLRTHLLTRCGVVITIGCSEEIFGYQQISRAYNDAFSAIGSKLAHPPGAVIHCGTVPPAIRRDYFYNPAMSGLAHLEEPLLREFSEHSGGMERAAAALQEVPELRQLSAEALLTFFTKSLIVCVNLLNSGELSPPERLRLNQCFSLPETASYPNLWAWYLQQCRMLDDCMENERRSKYRSTVEIVIAYVKGHYSEPISLTTMAELVHVSPNYLSKIFKEATGMNFKEWLIEYRIGCSKELLLNPDIKMYEIARSVGYSEYKYFAKLFKQVTGKSASDFRTGHR